MEYEIIVVGGGHAGCEAALVSSKKGHKTLLITSNISNIADMACNPSLGGSAKGVVIREIDALGGVMAKIADKSKIQIKKLNSKKGPAVQALRAQIDKVVYSREMIKTLKEQENLEVLEAMVENLLVENKQVVGVILKNQQIIKSKIVILTTGTYLKADILIGSNRIRKGPHNEEPSLYLSDNLKKLGFKIIRLKTGTPPRIDKKTINFSKIKEEKGDNQPLSFNHDIYYQYDYENQEVCYLTYTNERVHKIIKDNLNKSSMYGGLNNIDSIGPRYCPSIEDKIVRFKDKDRHQIFLEPESKDYDDVYIQGLSTSLPSDIQEKIVHNIEGLENAKILKYAYAIEYDAISPIDIKQTLETKIIKNLYTAGQINGTSGYEEAAGQGLIAGINASLKLEGKEPLILKRNEAYIGVLIDDLVTKGVIDPYRLLTSRAEYRLLLRNDNADIRLRQKGYEIGLISEKIYKKFQFKLKQISELEHKLKTTKINPTKEVNKYLTSLNSAIIKDGITFYDLLKRPEINISKLTKFETFSFDFEIIEQVEINIKYEGYIKKAYKEAEKTNKLEIKKIPPNINYDKIHNLASEAVQKLKEIKPTSIGQALRISGVNPTDISILMIYLKKVGKYE